MAEAKPDPPAPASEAARALCRTISKCRSLQRRRKQLRVAQQAYRKRKETTISTLQSRVQELESGIEELSQSFLSFSNLLFEADILEKHPRVTSAFQQITQQYVSLAKRGCDEPEQAAPAAATPATPATPNTLLKPSATPDLNWNYSPLLTQLDTLPMVDGTTPFSMALLDEWPFSQQFPPRHPIKTRQLYPLESSLPTTVSPNSLMKQGRGTLSHRLVRECYERGYRLLINSAGDEPSVQEIFGKPLNFAERNRLISLFYAALHDEVGDLIELRTKVLSFIQSMRNKYSHEQLAKSSRTWQIVLESDAEEWLDASGVQRLLQERGIRIQDLTSPLASPRFHSSPQLNVASFIQLLSHGPICVGRGPAFRRRDVESAIRLATSDNPWSFDVACEIP
ncbi:uncharacterized protein N7482_004083 [Penicillium canariense]|uniref:BZIP domain-containing protein n=1 Tax=Penicillium canariense TaxID=189055 RepID=A0A9W9LP16_9EURO|nr:uncharacterized protein N7482_004083 [Penicillium canariense]KAJ5168489.1 hypothetical protein N7482_004083 [Penicillium canariense]